MNKQDHQALGEALGLLNSMICSGERHTSTSLAVLNDARAVLRKLGPKDGQALTGPFKKTIGLDFDGVIHQYNEGWQGIKPTEGPTPGAKEAIATLRQQFEVVVFSTRCTDPKGPRLVQEWLDAHGIVVDRVATEKPKAVLMVDDRGYRFDGDWSALLEFVKDGAPEPWNRD